MAEGNVPPPAAEQILMVEFEGHSPEASNKDGIVQMLQRGIFKCVEIDVPMLADCIIARNYMGSVVKQTPFDDDDSDADDVIFGVTTVIELDFPDMYPVLIHIRGILQDLYMEYCNDHDRNLMSSVLNSLDLEKCGFLINERIYNIPPGIATPLMRALRDEMRVAIANGLTGDFTHFVLISKMVSAENHELDVSFAHTPDLLWYNPEEEFLYKNSIVHFDFPLYYINELGRGDDNTHTIRRLVLITRDVFERFVDQLE